METPISTEKVSIFFVRIVNSYKDRNFVVYSLLSFVLPTLSNFAGVKFYLKLDHREVQI